MMKKNLFKYLLILSLTGLVSCTSTKQVTSTAVWGQHEIECLGIDFDGTQQLKVYSKGANRSDAIEKALKMAVHAVTFESITGGDCNARPIIVEANAERKYEEYFHIFFATGGEYRKYVQLAKNSNAGTIKGKGDGLTLYVIHVNVDRASLRKRFESDHIIVK
jgi:hypothetical protein